MNIRENEHKGGWAHCSSLLLPTSLLPTVPSVHPPFCYTPFLPIEHKGGWAEVGWTEERVDRKGGGQKGDCGQKGGWTEGGDVRTEGGQWARLKKLTFFPLSTRKNIKKAEKCG